MRAAAHQPWQQKAQCLRAEWAGERGQERGAAKTGAQGMGSRGGNQREACDNGSERATHAQFEPSVMSRSEPSVPLSA